MRHKNAIVNKKVSQMRKAIHITLHEGQLKALRSVAKASGRTASEIIEEALTDMGIKIPKVEIPKEDDSK